MGELVGKVAIVTGRTGGTGKGTSARFAAEGARVVGRARSDDAVVERCVAAFGGSDILVNTAGNLLDNFVTSTTNEMARHLVDQPRRAVLRRLRRRGPHEGDRWMSDRKRHFVVGPERQSRPAAYSASKAGAHGLTLSRVKEPAKFSIRVNALSPAAPTEISVDMPEELRERALRRTTLRRAGTIKQVADAALFLTSDRSNFTTGRVLHVDGGLHLT